MNPYRIYRDELARALAIQTTAELHDPCCHAVSTTMIEGRCASPSTLARLRPRVAEQMFGAAESLSRLMMEQFGFTNPLTVFPKTGHGTLYEPLVWAWRAQVGARLIPRKDPSTG